MKARNERAERERVGKAIADEILRQLGGGRFAVMTGAKHFSFGLRSLHFRIGRNHRAINRVIIELNHNDYYNMMFFRLRGTDMKLVETVEDVSCDDLKDVFTSVTGLYTSLGRRV